MYIEYTAVLLVRDYSITMEFKHDTMHGFITECITGLAEIIILKDISSVEEITMLWKQRWLA